MTKTRSHAEHHEHILKMTKPEKRACGGTAKRAAGGKTAKGKGKGPQVNIMVAPRGGQDQAGASPASPGAMPGPVGAVPSRPSGPVAPPPAPGGPTGGLAALRGLGTPGAKRGGSVKRRASGGMVADKAGAASGEGRLEKERKERRVKK